MKAILPDDPTENDKPDSVETIFTIVPELTNIHPKIQDGLQVLRSHLWLIDLMYTYKTNSPERCDRIFRINEKNWRQKALYARENIGKSFNEKQFASSGIKPMDDLAQGLDVVLEPYQIRFYDQTAAGTGGTPFFKPREDLGYVAWDRWHGYIKELLRTIILP